MNLGAKLAAVSVNGNDLSHAQESTSKVHKCLDSQLCCQGGVCNCRGLDIAAMFTCRSRGLTCRAQPVEHPDQKGSIALNRLPHCLYALVICLTHVHANFPEELWQSISLDWDHVAIVKFRHVTDVLVQICTI